MKILNDKLLEISAVSYISRENEVKRGGNPIMTENDFSGIALNRNSHTNIAFPFFKHAYISAL